MSELTGLPNDLQELTAEQEEAFVDWLAENCQINGGKGYSLRQRQTIASDTIRQAYEQLQTAKDPVVRERLERGLTNGQILDDLLMRAVMKRFDAGLP